jgi:ATP-dependent Clp protease ATP-binding subunit ClpC
MKFAPRARSVVVAAQESARERGDDHIGTEHLALALTGSRETYAGECLESMGVTSERLTELLGPGAGKPVSGHIPFTADAKKVLELALREAIRGEARRIDTEHLLLALLRDKDSAGARALAQLGATPAQVESWLDGNAA